MAVTGHSWLTLVVNCKNELCSPSNNTVSKAFWQKKVLPEQKISYCELIYSLVYIINIYQQFIYETHVEIEYFPGFNQIWIEG